MAELRPFYTLFDSSTQGTRLMDAKSLINQVLSSNESIHEDAKDNIAASLSDSQSKIATELANLKDLAATGKDQSDLHSAIKYIEAGVLFMSRIVQRNVTRET